MSDTMREAFEEAYDVPPDEWDADLEQYSLITTDNEWSTWQTAWQAAHRLGAAEGYKRGVEEAADVLRFYADPDTYRDDVAEGPQWTTDEVIQSRHIPAPIERDLGGRARALLAENRSSGGEA